MTTENINNTKEYLTKNEFYSVISDLKQSMLDGFDRIFHVMDENKTELKNKPQLKLTLLNIAKQ